MINLTNKKLCCGCAACMQKCPQQCITMECDTEGFLYPKIEKENCINCGICEKVCAEIVISKERIPLQVLALYNKNEEIRLKSSSGGVFTLFSEEIINRGGVVFGAKFDADWNVVHGYTETIEGLAAFRGSKYVQSRIESSFKQAEVFLKAGREVLFTGTPCQIAALNLFLRREYENLLTVDFVCHGVPSPKVWQMYLKEVITHQGFEKKQFRHLPLQEKYTIEKINFRSKSIGWKKFSIAITLSGTTINGKKKPILLSSVFVENPFMQAFLKDMILRPSCYTCSFRKGKSRSDITIGDHWAIPYIRPDFDDDKGISLVLVNTKKGQAVLNKAQNIEYIETDYQKSQMFNGGFYDVTQAHPHRSRFFRKLDAVQYVSLLIKSELKVSFTERVIQKVRKIVRMK